MVKWTNETSAQLSLPTFKDTGSVTSSPESAGGVALCASPDGRTIDPSGREAVPANPSAQPDAGREPETTATCGRNSSVSSASAGLLRSLASRLQARMAGRGSTLFRLTWRISATPSGRQICALRASVRRISGNDCTSWPNLQTAVILASAWPTPTVQDAENCAGSSQYQRNSLPLNTMATLTAWPTPSAQGSAGEISEDLERTGAKWRNRKTGRVLQTNLATEAKMLANWATPKSTDAKGYPYEPTETRRSELRKQTSGTTSNGCPAGTEKRGQLNPAFCRWLMGFPAEWDAYAPTVTPLSRRSRQSS